MTIPNIAGTPILKAKLTQRKTDVWTCELTLDGEIDLAGQVSIDLGDGVPFVGTIKQAGKTYGKTGAYIVGGAGGLDSSLAPKWYKDALVTDVLRDIASDTGETLDTTLSGGLDAWVRVASQARYALTAICKEAGVNWRIARDGKLWIGVDSYDTVELPQDAVYDEHPQIAGVGILAEPTPRIDPGTTLLGRQVETVVYSVDSGKVTISALFASPIAPWGTTQRDHTLELARNVVAPTAYLGLYPMRVVTCSFSAQTVDVESELPDVIPGLTAVKIRSVPGLRIEVAQGQRVLVGFEGGDPSQPYAAIEWANNSQLVKATWDVTGIVQVGTGSAQFVALENLVKTELTNIKTMLDGLKTTLNAHTHSGVTAGGGVTGPLVTANASTYTVGEVKATQLKTV